MSLMPRRRGCARVSVCGGGPCPALCWVVSRSLRMCEGLACGWLDGLTVSSCWDTGEVRRAFASSVWVVGSQLETPSTIGTGSPRRVSEGAGWV